ncbi:hypothetical protein [Alistipes shahii]|uniref:hypothetical protein n=1 Tax=Alistipes shahii TaxID=328814 RepID=UPI0032EC3EE8
MANELFALLTEAKTVYLHDVVLGGKQYHRYVDDFVNGHRYIDCDHAACRNCHEMNIYIVKGLLTECASSVQPCFAAPDFTFNECMKLKRMYDISESLSPLGPPRINRPAALSLSFGCNFTPEQMKSIVACANTYHLFCVSVRIEDMEALFACKKGFSIRVNNIRRVVILFDALLENSFIQSRWQNVLGKGAFLQSKDGTRSVSVSTLSSALSSIKNNMTSVAYSIRKVIDRLKE